jgi:DNA processing protein
MIRTLTPESFPPLLASIAGAPRELHVRGTLPEEGGLAIVGTRTPTLYGLRMAREFATASAKAGIGTISGLARGIDTEVHRSTLAAGGRTWAVLAGGLDRVYPRENEELAEEIVAAGGGVLCEVPAGAPPLKHHFRERNRIISGLAWATVVVEGDVTSGALITAKHAGDQGREVLAVPGPADSPMSRGPLKLLRQGAAMACGWADVEAALPAGVRAPDCALTEDERRVLGLMGRGDALLDELLERTGFASDRLSLALLELEMKGQIRSCPGQRYAKT